VRAGARAASLERHRYSKLAGHVEERKRVELPTLAIEITREKPTAVVGKQRVDADRLVSAEMLLDRFVAQREIRVRGVLAPSARDCGDVAALAGPRVFPANRVHILASAEEALHERDLLAGAHGSACVWRWNRWREDGLCLLREREQLPEPLVLGAQTLELKRCLLEPVLQVGFGHGADRGESTAATGQTTGL
jgi:hypothetical protein